MEDNNFDAPVETKTDNSESVNTTEEVAKNTNETEENKELAEAYYKKDLRNAFAGEICWDHAKGRNTTVEAWKE